MHSKSLMLKLVLTAPNEFNAIWIENNYLDIISQQARSFAGTAVTVVRSKSLEEQTCGRWTKQAMSRTTVIQ